MNLIQKKFLAIARIGMFLYVKLGIYRLWSRLYQFIWERERVPLKKFGSFSEFVTYIRTLKWRPDTWRQLWDAFSNPYHIQYIANTDPARAVGDCDEFAIYEAEVLAQQGLAAEKPWEVTDTNVLTVTWYQTGEIEPGETRMSGHNVCLLRHVDGQWSYMDYGFPSKRYATVSQVADAIIRHYAYPATLIAWARSDRDLKCLEFGVK